MLIIYVWKLGENLTKFIQLIVKVYMYVNIACNSKLKLPNRLLNTKFCIIYVFMTVESLIRMEYILKFNEGHLLSTI